MSGTTLLINLAGAIALLLWGTHMISSALLRGFGTPLRHWMGRHLNNRWLALLAGIGITGILQSSTAVSLMATSVHRRRYPGPGPGAGGDARRQHRFDPGGAVAQR
jgi:phosphate:Na+ symporter